MSRRRGFFSRMLGGETDEGETRLYQLGDATTSGREEAFEEKPYGFSAERAAKIIDDLPPDVPQESAVRIVRGTLEAAGIKVEDLERSTRARESKLESEIGLARSRKEELQKRTEEVVRSLEGELEKAREACETGVAEEEQNIARAEADREGVRRVRAFFGFQKTEAETSDRPFESVASDSTDDETQVFDPFEVNPSQAARRPGPFADDSQSATNDAPPHGSYGTTDER